MHNKIYKGFVSIVGPSPCHSIQYLISAWNAQLWKPFIDPTTYQKARFVYTSDSNSLKMMEDLFDKENVDFNFKGKYNHTDYARLMQADDSKKTAFWDQANSYSGPIMMFYQRPKRLEVIDKDARK
eukprot:c24755_g1_i2 orf=230-607(-)